MDNGWTSSVLFGIGILIGTLLITSSGIRSRMGVHPTSKHQYTRAVPDCTYTDVKVPLHRLSSPSTGNAHDLQPYREYPGSLVLPASEKNG